MRAIESREITEKKERRSRLIGGVVLILIMILSSAGYAFYNYTSTNTGTNDGTQGLTFDGQYWNLPYQGMTLRFAGSPQQVSNISVNMSANPNDYVGNSVYVDSKNDSYIYGLIYNNLYISAGRIQQACYGKCVENLPEKDCTNYMIVFNKSTENKVWQKDKCVFIEGDINSIDAFFYKLYNIQS